MGKYLAAVVFSLPVVGWAVWHFVPASFTIRNESGQAIHDLTVAAGGRTYRVPTVPPGGEVSGTFYVDHEVTLDLRGRLADGTAFAEPCGYVVWEEVAPHVTVTVRSGVEVETRQ